MLWWEMGDSTTDYVDIALWSLSEPTSQR